MRCLDMLEAAAFINIIDVTMWLCRIEAYRGPGSTRHNNMGLHTLEGDSSRISDLSPGYTVTGYRIPIKAETPSARVLMHSRIE